MVGWVGGQEVQVVGEHRTESRHRAARHRCRPQAAEDVALHAGVTGEDLLHDLAPTGESDFDVVKRLGFGGADVIVAVPQAWVDVDTMSDLEAAGAAFRKAHQLSTWHTQRRCWFPPRLQGHPAGRDRSRD